MHLVHDAVHLLGMNREHHNAATTTRPKAHCHCEVAATSPSRGGLPKATGGDPEDVEEDDRMQTVVVLLTALACDVVGSVLSFGRSQLATQPTQCRSGR